MVLPVVEEPMSVEKTKERNESKVDKNRKKREKIQENKQINVTVRHHWCLIYAQLVSYIVLLVYILCKNEKTLLLLMSVC